jgi:hypothetical protein
MGIALLIPATLAFTARSLTHWFASERVSTPAANDSLIEARAPQSTPQAVRPLSGLPRQPRLSQGPVRNARMPQVRVLDGRQPGGSGRLVIAGRMSEVCAELDRRVRAEHGAC